ncbi:hypothetical protein [Luteibacter rhizovicinus]|nr:hypothetical protein [Luteibacter rhizovicinus]
MKKPDIKQNPNPKMRYEITVTIDDAPGPFDRIEGSVDYKVSNDRCVPLTPITGATVAPEKRVPLELTRTSDHVYKGTVFVDLLQDEDYFGMGVCHWSVVAAGVDVYVQKMGFSGSLFHDNLLAGKTDTRYFSKRSYFATDMDLINSGNAKRTDFKNPDDTFSISMKAEEKLK